MLSVAWFFSALILLLAYRLGKEAIEPAELQHYDTALFRAGAGLHIAVYVLGSNYDYRLMFLLLTLPWACRKLYEKGPIRKWMAAYFPLLLFVFWVNGQYGEMALVLNEFANWCIFFLLIGLQFKLLPPFLREAVFGQRANS